MEICLVNVCKTDAVRSRLSDDNLSCIPKRQTNKKSVTVCFPLQDPNNKEKCKRQQFRKLGTVTVIRVRGRWQQTSLPYKLISLSNSTGTRAEGMTSWREKTGQNFGHVFDFPLEKIILNVVYCTLNSENQIWGCGMLMLMSQMTGTGSV